jgi:hypothetical protein
MTHGNQIYYNPDDINGSVAGISALGHEIQHSVQYQEGGLVGFYWNNRHIHYEEESFAMENRCISVHLRSTSREQTSDHGKTPESIRRQLLATHGNGGLENLHVARFGPNVPIRVCATVALRSATLFETILTAIRTYIYIKDRRVRSLWHRSVRSTQT